MNRCIPRFSRHVLPALSFGVFSAFTLLPSLSHAQTALQHGEREFPANAQSGALQAFVPLIVLINGQPARIKTSTNTLVGSNAVVNHVRSAQTLNQNVWILASKPARA